MDTEMSLSPMPAQSVPASPSLGPRKRSIHEVDGAGNPSPSPKRSFPDTSTENQENRDPSLPLHPKEPPSPSSRQSFVVEIPTMNIDRVSPVAPTGGASVQSNPTQQVGDGSSTKSDTSLIPAAKKRKLSPASQQAKQQEKEEKERQKAEEKHKKEEDKRLKEEEKKAAKEEEKRLKEEEKKKREAEREEEKKQREEKKKAKEEEKAAKEAAKEEEKRRKEEEKQKKEKVCTIEVH